MEVEGGAEEARRKARQGSAVQGKTRRGEAKGAGKARRAQVR